MVYQLVKMSQVHDETRQEDVCTERMCQLRNKF